jgi:hypothetical protein
MCALGCRESKFVVKEPGWGAVRWDDDLMAMLSKPSPRPLTTPRAAALPGVIYGLLFGASR